MFDNHDPGDVTGLETLFESRHFGRTAGAGGAVLAAAVRSTGLEETILAMEFGGGARELTVRGVSESGGRDDTPRDDALMTLPEPTTLPTGSDLPTASAGGAASGNGEPPVPSAPSPKRGSNSYRMIAAASCVAALVVAGVTSQVGQKRPPGVSALGGHRAGGHSESRDRNGTPSVGTPSSDTPTSGTPAHSRGSAGFGAGHGPSVSLASSTSGARSAPGGHVAVSGAATDNGTPPSSLSSPGPGGPAPSPAGSGGSAGTSAGTLVASTLNTVATSASTVSGQLGSSVPGAGPVTNALRRGGQRCESSSRFDNIVTITGARYRLRRGGHCVAATVRAHGRLRCSGTHATTP